MRRITLILVAISLLSTKVSASERLDISERLKILAPERASKIAVAMNGVVYRFWELPAAEHLSGQAIILFELRFWAGNPQGDFEGELSALIGLPDGKVFREVKQVDQEAIQRIGRVLWQTEVLGLPRFPEIYDSITTPGGDVGFHAGAWEIEAFDSWSEHHVVVQRPRFEGTAMGRVRDAFRLEAKELINKLVEHLPPE